MSVLREEGREGGERGQKKYSITSRNDYGMLWSNFERDDLGDFDCLAIKLEIYVWFISDCFYNLMR